MKNHSFLFCLAVAVLLGGCITNTSPASRFYMLTALPETQAEVIGQAGSILLVGPGRLADYLSRPPIIQTKDGGGVDILEFDRWSESLDSGFQRVLVQNLSGLLGSESVTSYPWPTSSLADYQLHYNVERFDCSTDNSCRLIIGWSIIDRGSHAGSVIKRSNYTEGSKDSKPESIVVAHSRLIAAFAREAAVVFTEITAKAPAAEQKNL